MRLADGEEEAVSAIGPGDWVECVDSRGWEHLVPVGSVHLVEDVTMWQGRIPSLILKGIASPSGYREVLAECFRPIYRPKADLIESLKAPPVRVGEFA